MSTQEISLLLVGNRCAEIASLLHHTRWRVYRARSVGEARVMLKRVAVQVVLCQHTLPDGTWLSVLDGAEECDPAPAVVVLAEPDARIWAEVLSSGGYDLLPLPCNAAELYTIVPMAWRRCMKQQHAGTAAA